MRKKKKATKKDKRDEGKENVVEFPQENEELEEGLKEPDSAEIAEMNEIPDETEEAETPDELELLRREKDAYLDQLLRKQAEFENYRKRVLKEKQELENMARMGVLEGLLPIVDAFEKGIENLRSEPDQELLESYLEGYELLFKQIKAFLERHNVEVVPGVGSMFDPNIHEAVLREESEEHRDGEILEEYRRGYTMNNQLLRAAQVKVAVHPD